MKSANIMIRLLAGMLAAMTVFSVVACGKTDEPSETTTAPVGEVTTDAATEVTTATPVETAPTHDANGYLLDDIPEQNHGGQKVTVLVYKEGTSQILPDEDNALNLVHNTVYMRTVSVEERLGIEFDPIYCDGGWTYQTEFISKATLAGENYDLIASYSLWPQVLAVQGHLYNLKNQIYPNLDQPWWCRSVKEWEQHGSLFFVASNSSVRFISEAEAIFANMPMLNNYGAEDPTMLVLEGKWTLDKLHEMSSLMHTDVNSDGINIPYGLTIEDQSRLDMFYYGACLNATRTGDDGLAFVCMDDEQEKMVNLVDKVIALFHRNEAAIATGLGPMQRAQTAFMACCLTQVTKMDDTTIYTALPVPKYDEEQSEYRTVNTNGFDVWCIPLVAKNPELSATVMEAIASEDYRTVAPFYYDQYLKLRYSNNDIGVEIYDIIRNSVFIDFGRISAVNLGILETVFRNAVQSGTNKVASSLKAESRIWDRKLNTILDAYAERQGQ